MIFIGQKNREGDVRQNRAAFSRPLPHFHRDWTKPPANKIEMQHVAVTKMAPWRSDEEVSMSPLSVADAAVVASSAQPPAVYTRQRTNPSASPWFPGLLTACLSYLDLVALLQCELVAEEWRAAALDPALWTQQYCSLWRSGQPLPLALGVGSGDMKRVCRERSRVSLGLSTRAMWWVHNNETLRVHNVSLQRKFDAGCVESIRTDHALQPLGLSTTRRSPGVTYFEAGIQGCGSVGVILLSAPNIGHFYGAGSSAHVGWLPGSYGYHGDDGKIYWHDGTAPIGGFAVQYGPSWGDTRIVQSAIPTEDIRMTTIGCGVDLARGRLFFTKNGEFMGHAHMRLEANAQYGAAVSLHHLGDTAELNFGRAAFMFDIEAYIAAVVLRPDMAPGA